MTSVPRWGEPRIRSKELLKGSKQLFCFGTKEEGADGATLSHADEKEFGRILKAYEIWRALGRTGRFTKPVTLSALRPG